MVAKTTVFVLFLFLASCGLPDIPDWNPHIIDVKGQSCIPCKLVDKKTFTFKCEPEKSLGLQACEGYFATSPSETAAWRRWAVDVKDNYKCEPK